jgi:hypothetical protein
MYMRKVKVEFQWEFFVQVLLHEKLAKFISVWGGGMTNEVFWQCSWSLWKKKITGWHSPSWCRENHVLPISNVQEYGVVVN